MQATTRAFGSAERIAAGSGRRSTLSATALNPEHYELSQLAVLESEAIQIFREVVSELERPVLLFSGGKGLDRDGQARREGVLARPPCR